MKNNRFTKKLSALLLSACVVLTALTFSGIIASADDTAALPKIWLDAGHGGSDPGAMNGDRHEADDNLRVTLAVGEKLEAAGFDVGYSRKTDVYVDLGDRVPMAKQYGADFVISFHRNSAGSPAATGLETYYHFKENTDSTAYKLANTLQINTQAITGWANRGTKADGDPSAGDIGLRITRNSWENGIAGALIELGFISNDSDNATYDEKFDEMVTGLATAISETAGGGEITDYIRPYEKDGELHLTDCDSIDGWWTAEGTEIAVEHDNGTGRDSVHMKNRTSFQDHPAGVGAMAFLDFDPDHPADLSKYNKLRFSLWSSIDYVAADRRWNDIFQINLVTRTEAGGGIEQDGYNIPVYVSDIHKGWNDFIIDLDEQYKAVATADISKIHRLRFTWFNFSNGISVEFNIDNVVCYYVDDANILCSCEKDTEDVFNFNGNKHGMKDGVMWVDGQTVTDSYPGKDQVINTLYARVGKKYGDTDYTRSFDYTRYYYQFEMLFKCETFNTIYISHGNEQNNMEWQFTSSADPATDSWERIEIRISDIEAKALMGDCEHGLNDVNLLHIAQAQKGVVYFKDMALVTKEYDEQRTRAVENFFFAVYYMDEITAKSGKDLDYAIQAKKEAEQFINVQTFEFETYCLWLDKKIAEYNDIISAQKGDVDLDGNISANDALCTLQSVVGIRDLSPKAAYAADIGNKDKITSDDALLILQTTVGIYTKEDLQKYTVETME